MSNLPPGAFSAMLQMEADESLAELAADRAQEWLERMTGDELLEMVEFADDYSADFGVGSGNEWEFVGFETEELDEDVALKLGC